MVNHTLSRFLDVGIVLPSFEGNLGSIGEKCLPGENINWQEEQIRI